MSEIILELSLSRSSGVLAGVVASLAQAGIELRTQRVRRATEGRGGWLTVNAVGEPPAPETMAKYLSDTRGVEKLMRMIVDGEVVMAEGKPIEDQIQLDDLTELWAGSEAESGMAQAMPAKASQETQPEVRPAAPPAVQAIAPAASLPAVEDMPILSEPETSGVRDVAEVSDPPPIPTSDPVDGEFTGRGLKQDPAAPPGSIEPPLKSDTPPPEFAADQTAEGDLADAVHDESGSTDTPDPDSPDDETRTARMGATVRRRRRRRR